MDAIVGTRRVYGRNNLSWVARKSKNLACGLLIARDTIHEVATSKYEWGEPVPFANETVVEAAESYAELRADGEMIDKTPTSL